LGGISDCVLETTIIEPDYEANSIKHRKWYLEPQLGLLILLVLAFYFPRITHLSVRGEESRRARVAVEMIENGDWLIPRQQGQVYLSRPPLQNWLIAMVGLIRGEVDQIAIRLPSSLAILFTVILVYGYSRIFLTPTGSLVAGASFATMGQVMELGWLGETEAVFTFFVTASLLLWHWGDERNWSPWIKWCLPYTMVAFGCLAKGLQAPVYFAGTIGIYLLLSGRWKEALSLSHFAGILVFFGLWGGWQGAYQYQLGWEKGQGIYSRMILQRFQGTNVKSVIEHMVVFPGVFFFNLLPWSGLLLAMFYPGFWKTLGHARSHMLFLIVGVIVAFLSLWPVPGAKTRYLMPIYPCVAIMIGLIAQRCWEHEHLRSLWTKSWRIFGWFVAGCSFSLSCALLIFGTQIEPTSMNWQPTGFMIGFAVWSLVLSVIIFRASNRTSHRSATVMTLCIAVFMGSTFFGPWVNRLIRRTPDTVQQVAEIRQLVPTEKNWSVLDVCLTSLLITGKN